MVGPDRVVVEAENMTFTAKTVLAGIAAAFIFGGAWTILVYRQSLQGDDIASIKAQVMTQGGDIRGIKSSVTEIARHEGIGAEHAAAMP